MRCRCGCILDEERILLARLEAARQVYNACLGEARNRVRLVRESKAFQQRGRFPGTTPSARASFERPETQHGFSDYALQAYAKQFGHAWLGEHLDSHVLQKLATRAYGAANRLLVGRAKRVRFKGTAPTGQCGGQDQRQLACAGAPTTWSGAGWCCRPASIRVIWWWSTACPVPSSTCASCAARWGSATASLPNWSAREGPTARRGTRSGRASWDWTWVRARSRWWPSRRRCSSPSARR